MSVQRKAKRVRREVEVQKIEMIIYVTVRMVVRNVNRERRKRKIKQTMSLNWKVKAANLRMPI